MYKNLSFLKNKKNIFPITLVITTLLIVLFSSFYSITKLNAVKNSYQNSNEKITIELQQLQTQLSETQNELLDIKNTDQVLRNDQLEQRMTELKKTYAESVKHYERILVLSDLKADTNLLEKTLAKLFTQISKDQLEESKTTLAQLNKDISDVENKLKTTAAAPAPSVTKTSNQPPASGYSRQNVTTDIGNFVVSMVAGDLSNTRVIVDTASTSDCANNCPVLPLAEYVNRNGGYAGINGSYFCPESYPSCAGKTNSFDLLVMNKDKVYFNSANNVYSNNPAVIFSNNNVRFVSAAQEWGRDTSVDGVLSNFPLLLMSGEIRFGGNDDPKQGSKGNRSFVANKGNVVYIGVVHSATVAETAKVLKALDMQSAMNLDSGGSTALWSGGYITGPGRNIPNAIVFVKK